jgi:hypothetical protein
MAQAKANRHWQLWSGLQIPKAGNTSLFHSLHSLTFLPATKNVEHLVVLHFNIL